MIIQNHAFPIKMTLSLDAIRPRCEHEDMSRHITRMTIDDAEHYTPEQRQAIIDVYPEHARFGRLGSRSPRSATSLDRLFGRRRLARFGGRRNGPLLPAFLALEAIGQLEPRPSQIDREFVVFRILQSHRQAVTFVCMVAEFSDPGRHCHSRP
jgi:hypothetical protein